MVNVTLEQATKDLGGVQV